MCGESVIMQWFQDLKISAKIISIVVLMGIFMSVVGVTGYYFSSKLSEDLDNVYKNYLLPVQWLNDARNQSRAGEVAMMELLNPGVSRERAQKSLKDMDQHDKQFQDLIANYENIQLQPFEKELLPKLKEEISNYKSERQKTINLALAGKNSEGYQYFTQNVIVHLDKVNQLLTELADFNSKSAGEINKQGKQDSSLVIQMIIGITVIALLISLLAGWAISRMIARRLQIIVTSLQSVAEGDLAQRVQVMAKDEIGVLGHALNTTTQHLRNLVSHIVQSAEQLTAASEELTSGAEQSALATDRIAATINQVAEGAEKQVSATDDTKVVIEEMSVGIQQIASDTSDVAEMTEKTSDAAYKGENAVNLAVSQMATIEVTVTRSSEVVSKLGERSNEIGKIVDTISGIASQTNLLALNAAIEAARAGEQGRGFAVVAEEVRKLAEQSQEAAKHIASLIHQIQTETDQAVIAMKAGTHEVQVGTQVVTSAGQSFKEIVDLINKVTGQVRGISAAIQQMAGGSQQIVESVRHIDEISQDAAGHTQTVSAAAQEQSASMQEIVASSESLATMAQDLQNEVTRFKL